MNFKNAIIAVIGQGYVGLPLAIEFGKKRETIGFDIDKERINELTQRIDSTLEVEEELLEQATFLSFTSTAEELKRANVYIVTVPTPVDRYKKPDLTPLIVASEMLGSVVCKGDVVIYESTVYPGVTEETCIPVIENISGFKFNQDFFAGYSPERINPGDKEHRVVDILKITSGSTPEIAEMVDQLYKEIIRAGTYKATSIRVAEAAKVIENTQRDVNIALINELAVIFNKMGIDTLDVLEAAGSKWNFLPFRPGLVGGHCIGIDPYYLTHKAEEIGYRPQMILAGRLINDNMGKYVVSELIKAMLKKYIRIDGASVLILGFTFKENCSDIRNTKVVDIVLELQDYGVDVDIHDPWASPKKTMDEYGVELISEPRASHYDAVLIAVAHNEFKLFDKGVLDKITKERSIIYDLKYMLPKSVSDLRL